MRNFLAGVLVGCVLTFTVVIVRDAYTAMNQRVSHIEGYLAGLDRMLRAQ